MISGTTTRARWFSRRRLSMSRIEILGAAIVTLDVASDKPIANLVVRLCDVHPSGESLRVSYGVLNLTHRDGHEKPALLAVGQRYRVRIQLNDAGSVFPAGHRVRLAISTAYWPMIWPSPEKATLLISGGTLDLPVRAPRTTDALLTPLPGPESAPPEKPTISRRDRYAYRAHRPHRPRVGHAGRIRSFTSRRTTHSAQWPNCDGRGRCRGTHGKFASRRRCGSPAGRDVFLLQGSLRAWEGANEVCHREWDRSIPRDFV